MTPASSDRRVRRTRARLRAAFTQLIQEKELREITVRELTDRADVNRGTFYAHFQDLDDMLAQLEEELFGQFSDLLGAVSPDQLRFDLSPILEGLFAFVKENGDICQPLLEVSPDNRFFRRLSTLIYRKCLEDWQGLYPVGDLSQPNYYLEFVVNGAVGLVRAWVALGFRESPEEMAALASRLILSGLSSLTPPTP